MAAHCGVWPPCGASPSHTGSCAQLKRQGEHYLKKESDNPWFLKPGYLIIFFNMLLYSGTVPNLCGSSGVRELRNIECSSEDSRNTNPQHTIRRESPWLRYYSWAASQQLLYCSQLWQWRWGLVCRRYWRAPGWGTVTKLFCILWANIILSFCKLIHPLFILSFLRSTLTAVTTSPSSQLIASPARKAKSPFLLLLEISGTLNALI